MSVIFQLLIAMIFIAGMILFRLLIERRVVQTRIRGDHAAAECEQSGCLRGCETGSDAESVNEPDTESNI
jgi:hypothetical protein